jgi:hypothetical protein
MAPAGSVFIIPGTFVKNGDERLVALNRIAKSVVEAHRGISPRSPARSTPRVPTMRKSNPELPSGNIGQILSFFQRLLQDDRQHRLPNKVDWFIG